ncbi:hypothetical protein GCM10009663_21080 [Kitasatospora arboriphila]|uniref:Uncharacterized protein n=1 Tax=Kitasatospora arboriphila TaxID=258052 RepID=A0ABN1TFW6_9ACTN
MGQRAADRAVGELVEQDAVAVREFADLGAGQTADRDARSAVGPDACAPGEQQVGEPGRLRPPHHHLRAEPGAPELRGTLVRHLAPPGQGDHPVGHRTGLLRGAGGQQHRATRCGEGPQEGVQPLGAARRESGRRVVQQQGLRVAEQGGCQGEPTVHAG